MALSNTEPQRRSATRGARPIETTNLNHGPIDSRSRGWGLTRRPSTASSGFEPPGSPQIAFSYARCSQGIDAKRGFHIIGFIGNAGV